MPDDASPGGVTDETEGGGADIPPPPPPPPPPDGNGEDGHDLEVNVASVDVTQTKPFNEAEAKATGARETARWLLWAFTGTIVATFLTLFLVFGLSASPSQAKLFVDAFVGLVTTMENFITKIFGPLLAFVLGYYFGQKDKSHNPTMLYPQST